MNFRIVIPTHNAADYLDLCLYSLKKHAFWEHEYHVILDDCQDNTQDICEKYKVYYYSVNFHHPYKTRNSIKEFINLSEDFYLFMTADDMFASPNWDRKILAHHEREKDVVWSSQLTDYLLFESYEDAKKENVNLQIEDFTSWWASKGIHMDFRECGTNINNFNKEIFLAKFDIISEEGQYYNSERDGIRDVLCNTNFLIKSFFWKELSGWPLLEKEPIDARLGNNDVLFQHKVVELGGRNIVPKDVLFFHFGGRTINRELNNVGVNL